jgi:hypothetical protein
MGRKQALVDIYSNTLKHLLLSIIDCHGKHDFDWKLSSAQFEGNGSI